MATTTWWVRKNELSTTARRESILVRWITSSTPKPSAPPACEFSSPIKLHQPYARPSIRPARCSSEYTSTIETMPSCLKTSTKERLCDPRDDVQHGFGVGWTFLSP